jgi:hypothetical protein
MDPIFSFFIFVNAYAFFITQLTRAFRHHGEKRGFLLSNLIVVGVLVLVGLVALGSL